MFLPEYPSASGLFDVKELEIIPNFYKDAVKTICLLLPGRRENLREEKLERSLRNNTWPFLPAAAFQPVDGWL